MEIIRPPLGDLENPLTIQLMPVLAQDNVIRTIFYLVTYELRKENHTNYYSPYLMPWSH